MVDANIYQFNSTPRYACGCLILALIFAFALASLPVDAFVDRDNYLRYASSAAEIFARGFGEGPAYIVTNEPVWLLINVMLSFFCEDEDVVRMVVFISSLLSAYLLLRVDSKFFFILLLFLILPQVLKNYVVHLRQGLAVAVFLLGWFSRGGAARNVLILLTPFIHASFFFVVVIYYCSVVFALLRFSSGLRVALFALAGGTAAFSALWLASSLGARQAEAYSQNDLDISGLGFIYWSAIATVYFLQGKTFLKENSFQVGMLVFYLAVYFFLPVSGRIFESALILVLLSGLRLTSWRRALYYLLFCFYFIMQWLPRLSQPGFGWGVENYI
ncbi:MULTISPECIES: EpsG family protein [Pseudomonas]|uniref:EpsG family protein n=1 Tax=Pseudomonas rhizophila TaxID=2045200 RepID=UPI0013001B8C|nr:MULTISPECIES: EpsG family protein [Pseudomonas]